MEPTPEQVEAVARVICDAFDGHDERPDDFDRDLARRCIAAMNAEPPNRERLWQAFVAGYRQGSDEDLSGAFERFVAATAEPQTRLRNILGDIRGACTDEADHRDIDRLASKALDLLAEPLTSTPEPSTTETRTGGPINQDDEEFRPVFEEVGPGLIAGIPPGFSWEYRAVCDDGNRRAGLRSSWNIDADFAHDYARQFFGPRAWWLERRLVGPAERVEDGGA